MENDLKDFGVFPGGFDPPHNGHLWLIEQGVLKYSRLYVAVSQNVNRQYEFSLDERLEMLREITKSYDNTSVEYLEPGQFLVDYARQKSARYILRGLRNIEDFVAEMDMWNNNRRFDPDILTEFLMPPEEYQKISSHRIRELVRLQPWEERVRPLVHEFVFEKLFGKYENINPK